MKKYYQKKIQIMAYYFSGSYLTACTNKQGSNMDKLRVVTTNSIIADITKNIAGDKITLHSIVPLVRILTNTNLFLMM